MWTHIYSAGGMQGNAGGMQGECRGNAGGMQGECRGNAGGMQGECRGMQGECRGNAGGMQGECRGNAGGMQGECRGNAGGMQGECRGNAATVLANVNVTVALRSLASAVSSLTQYTDTVHYFPNHAKSQSGLTSILRAKLRFGLNKNDTL